MGGNHPARPLLAGVVVFWQAGRLREVSVRGGERDPRTRERALVGRQKLVASRHGLVAGWGVEGVVRNELCRSGLYPCASTCSSRTSGDQVTGLATITTETSVRSATAFLEGEWTPSTSSAIQIHGDMLGRGGWLRRAGKWKGGLFGGEGGT